MQTLTGKVAVVTGASRGAGRAIAAVLGEAGATVYVTGRTVRGGAAADNMPGTIETTAEEVTARGGRGVAVRCDHTVDGDVEALVERACQRRGGETRLAREQCVGWLRGVHDGNSDDPVLGAAANAMGSDVRGGTAGANGDEPVGGAAMIGKSTNTNASPRCPLPEGRVDRAG